MQLFSRSSQAPWQGGHEVHGRVADEPPGDAGRRGEVSLVVGDDLRGGQARSLGEVAASKADVAAAMGSAWPGRSPSSLLFWWDEMERVRDEVDGFGGG